MADPSDGPATHEVTRREAWRLAGVVRSPARSDIRVFVSLVTPAGSTMRPGTRSGRSRARQVDVWARVLLALAVAAGVVALAGCGSSKPAYCADRTSLENSVKGLTSLNVSSGVSGLKSQVTMIQSDATALVSSAKGDFPSQTSAITSSVDALKRSVAALSPSPSAAEVATVTKDSASVVSSVKSFTDATSSQCG